MRSACPARTAGVAEPVGRQDGALGVPVLEERLAVRTELLLKKGLRTVRGCRGETFRQQVRPRAERAEVTALTRTDHQPDQPEG